MPRYAVGVVNILLGGAVLCWLGCSGGPTVIADDEHLRATPVTTHAKCAAHRIFAGPPASGHGFIDHCDVRRPQPVLPGDIPPVDQRDAHRAEIVGAHPIRFDAKFFAIRGRVAVYINEEARAAAGR